MHRDLMSGMFGSILAVVTLCASPSARAAADEGWRACADEGQTCRVQGRAVVRYGDTDRWTTRSVVGSVVCGNAAFGDPAPEVAKRCEVQGAVPGGASKDRGTAGPRQAEWQFCAAEGEICRFRGQAQVRFGEGSRFTTRNAYDSVRCDVTDFGDPAYGVTKTCEVRGSPVQSGGSDAWRGWGAKPGAADWRYCAAEGETCRIEGGAQVRFGEGRRYNTRPARGEVSCSVDVFGDPAFGTLKHCEVQASALRHADAPDWRRCAGEGERCEFQGRSQVRYGTAGRYVYRDAYNGVRCDTRSFGSDPYTDRVKSCEIRR